MADYIPNTPQQQQQMLESIGLQTMEDLFADIPSAVRLQKELDLPPALAEMELAAQVRKLSAASCSLEDCCCFLGAGAYDHYIPAAVKSLVSRQEFYTAYTPYQPEISQGTLQAIFEYQTMICELTGMDLANASMYDGASALAEAALMACQATQKKRLLVAGAIHPDSLGVLSTYARFGGQTVESFAWGKTSGNADLDDLAGKMTDDTAAVIIQNPNFFGMVEDLRPIAELAHSRKALLIVSCDPISLGLLQDPGAAGADIVVGEGQALGSSLSFGGPYLGFFAARQELMRRMPGRIVGETVDTHGQRCYVLTLQAREQHIRREKATSNICSNQSLNALAAAIYLALTGRQGLREVAGQCVRKARYLYGRLLQLPRFQPVFDRPFFKEFPIRYAGDIARLNHALFQTGFIGGYEIGRAFPELPDVWLLAVTEKRTREEIDRFVAAVSQAIAQEVAGNDQGI